MTNPQSRSPGRINYGPWPQPRPRIAAPEEKTDDGCGPVPSEDGVGPVRPRPWTGRLPGIGHGTEDAGINAEQSGNEDRIHRQRLVIYGIYLMPDVHPARQWTMLRLHAVLKLISTHGQPQ